MRLRRVTVVLTAVYGVMTRLYNSMMPCVEPLLSNVQTRPGCTATHRRRVDFYFFLMSRVAR